MTALDRARKRRREYMRRRFGYKPRKVISFGRRMVVYELLATTDLTMLEIAKLAGVYEAFVRMMNKRQVEP